MDYISLSCMIFQSLCFLSELLWKSAYPSEAQEFTSIISSVRVVQSLVRCQVFFRVVQSLVRCQVFFRVVQSLVRCQVFVRVVQSLVRCEVFFYHCVFVLFYCLLYWLYLYLRLLITPRCYCQFFSADKNWWKRIKTKYTYWHNSFRVNPGWFISACCRLLQAIISVTFLRHSKSLTMPGINKVVY